MAFERLDVNEAGFVSRKDLQVFLKESGNTVTTKY
jgi:Ca2+-binding EF-hand superfamily protein